MILKGMASYFHAEINHTMIASIEDGRYYEYDGYVFMEIDPDVRGLKLAEYLDSELENANYHSFVGMYEKIYKHMLNIAGRVNADDILEAIAKDGVIP